MNTICLNDTSNTTNIYVNKTVCSFFWQQFSTKSKYELYDTDNLQETATLIPKEEKKKDIHADGQANTYLYF